MDLDQSDPTPLTPFNSDASLIQPARLFGLGSPPPIDNLSSEDEVEDDVEEVPVMATPEAIHPGEAKLMMLIQNRLEKAQLFIDGRAQADAAPAQPQRFRKASTDLRVSETELTELEDKTITRISKIQNTAIREASRKEWVKYQVDIINQIEDLRDALVATDPDKSTAEELVAASLADCISDIQNLHTQVDSLLKQIEADLTTFSANENEVSRGAYTALKSRMLEVQKMIRPQMEELFKDRLSLKAETAEVTHTAHTAEIKALDLLYSNLWNKLHAAKLDETILTFNPPASSTQDNSILGASGRTNFGRGGYSYRNEKTPIFNGDPAVYQAWKKEMVEDVLKGLEPRHQVRLISENSGHPKLYSMFDDPVDAWEWLDQKYANEVVICDTVCTAFLDMDKIPGHNDPTRIVNLLEYVREMQMTLKTYSEEDQLTTVRPMLIKLVKLFPDKYKEEYTYKLQSHEETLGTKLKGKVKFEFILKYMKDKVAYINVNLAHMLVKTNKNAGTGAGGGDDTVVLPRNTRKNKNKPAGVLDVKTNAVQEEQKKPRGSSATGGPPDGSLTQRTKDYCKQKWAEFKVCPACNAEGHYYEGPRGWGPSQFLSDCPKFRNEMNVNQRADIVINKKLCIRCLCTQHHTKECRRDKKDWYCREMEGSKQCGQQHSSYLHGSSRKLVNFIKSQPIFDTTFWQFEELTTDDMDAHLALRQDAMLPVVAVQMAEGIIGNILCDPGSTSTIILNSFASTLGMKPIVINTNVTVCGRKTKNADLNYYAVTVQLEKGPRKIYMLGMDRLTSVPGDYDVSPAHSLFPHIQKELLSKPGGEIHIIIGQDNGDLLPSGGQGINEVGRLRVSDIPFGPGVVLTGSHPDIKFENPVMSADTITACYLSRFSRPPKDFISCQVNTITADPPMSFLEADMLGYNAPPRCDSCNNCEVCTFRRQGMTVKEKREFQTMRENLSHDPETNTITVSYPVVDPKILELFQDNMKQAIARQTSFRTSLKKRSADMLADYNDQFRDYIQRGVLVPVSPEEIQSWKDSGEKIHYVLHHGVEKPDSLSTKLRIVVDSSLRNNNTGPRLTELYMKGPNTINDLYRVLISWRSFVRAGVFDVKKAYHSLKTTLKEKFMRLVVWKFEDDEDWQVWGHVVVGMGDISASGFLELAKMKAAELGVSIDPIAAQQLLDMAYVDDGLCGGSQEQLEKMRGPLVFDEDGKQVFKEGTVPRILGTIGCKVKNMTLSYDSDPRVLGNQGKVLGIPWDPASDVLKMKIVLRLVQKKRNRTISDVPLTDIAQLDGVELTRRVCLQFAAQTFDPIGLITAYSVRFKILLRDIIARDLDWDDILPEDLQGKWVELITEVLGNPELVFPRSITVEHAVDRPELIIFTDGSTVAFGAVVYVRFRLTDSPDYHTALVSSKSRVTPRTGLTAPRSELQGLIVGARLADVIIPALNKRPVRLTIATDSQCSVAAVDENANALAVFFSNRVIEFVGLMEAQGPASPCEATVELTEEQLNAVPATATVVDKLNHTPGEGNPADWPTRGNYPWSLMGSEGEWQLGPSYLRSPRSSWPFTRDFVSKIPVEEKRKRFLEANPQLNLFSAAVFTVSHHSKPGDQPIAFFRRAEEFMMSTHCFLKAKCTMARLCRIFRLNDDGARHDLLERRDIKEAEWFFQLASMPYLRADLQRKGSLDSLNISWSGGVARTRGRLSPRSMMAIMGYSSLVVLPYSCRLAFLVLKEAHDDDHRAAGDTLWRARRKGYWIVRGLRLAQTIVDKCVKCKRVYPTMEQQAMADLPPEIFKVPCRAFSHIQLDYAGAVTVKDQVKKRVDLKCFPLIFVCMNSGAVHCQLAPGYSAKDFIVQFQHFCSLRGTPSLVHTDQGSQLVAVGKKVQDGDLPQLPWVEIQQHEVTRGIDFIHCPTQAQWRNGRAESAVRAFKKTLKFLIPGHQLTFAEYSCLLSRAADKINQRPLGVRHHGGAEGDVCTVTPHMLIQGGQQCEGIEHQRNLAHDVSRLDARMAMVEDSFALWWRQWMIQVWDSLVPTKKWRTSVRNVTVGDIVLVRYESKLVKPTFRLGRITEIFPDEHGKVRDVTVDTVPKARVNSNPIYKPGKLDHQKLPVQRLAVLLPADEVGNLPPADDTVHVCSDTIRIPDLRTVEARDRPRRASTETPLTTITEEPQSDPSLDDTAPLPEVDTVASRFGNPDSSVYIHTISCNIETVRCSEFKCVECVQRHNVIRHRDWKEAARQLLSSQD